MTKFDTLMRQRHSFNMVLAGLGAAVVLSILLAVCVGIVPISPAEACHIILYKIWTWAGGDTVHQFSPVHADIIWQLRLPRVLMAAVTGAGLALCGAVMQASLQNPLAEPYILGISSGASLGAVFAILVGASAFGIPFWAFTGAAVASLLVILLSGGGPLSSVKMVLAGAIANTLFTAAANFIIYAAGSAEGIRTVAFWTMGSLAAAKWPSLLLPALAVTVSCLFFLSQHRTLNALLLGEETAVTLGIDAAHVRRIYFTITALMTGLIVASCGVIGFVAFVVPHIMRGLAGSDHKRLTPAVILAGALFLTWADVLARTALASGEVPLGIITALIGGPFFMYILWKQSYSFNNR
ncbi:FecCD family ABC transporter permease [Acetonema longum]|uniref:ABC transporter transmembrane protein n=1 Tax=Acetonema longum DSM 6540 TaxID=1009370 RepID=F7NET9_9FIRM|nr:iron ABC transporter permease [Acetonema longum]EGO65500.1 ABC transporter transmembrane protein [Acetonema longum DSM 6540]